MPSRQTVSICTLDGAIETIRDTGASRAMTNVVETVELALTTIGSPAVLARALGVTPSHVSRLRRGTAGVGPECSLRLSRIIGRPALDGLREDGYAELADLMQALVDSQDDKRIATQRSLADDLAELPPTDFRHVRALVASLANAARRVTNAPR